MSNNYYKLLNTLNFQKTDTYINCLEIVDVDKLYCIIMNEDVFKPIIEQFNGQPFDDTYNPFAIAKKYLEMSRKGIVNVNYRQNSSVGRYYAIESLSMQCIPKQIRHTVCKDLYIDVDIKNCHPSLLKFVCDQNDIHCPILSKYVLDRDQFFIDNQVSKSVGKIVFLSVMNGGSSDYNSLSSPSNDFKYFYGKEIKRIHNAISLIHPDKFQKHKEKRRKIDGINHNHKGSFMNIILCDIENKILHTMIEYWGKPENCVLCFDGVMLPINTVVDLNEAEQYITDTLGIVVDLEIKPFQNVFDLTKFQPLKHYEEMSLEFYPDFRNIVNKIVHQSILDEWVENALTIIENGGNSFFLTKNQERDSLTMEDRIYYKQVKIEYVLSNLQVCCNVLNLKFNKALYDKFDKMSEEEFTKQIKKLTKSENESRCMFKYYNISGTKGNGYLQDMMRTRSIKSFNSVEFYPFLKRNGEPKLHDSFNIFTGYPLDRIEYKSGHYNFEDSHLYIHIRDELMNGEEGEFNHFLDHIADMIQDPAHIKTNGHLFYTKQGMGKGMLAEFVSKLIGTDHFISFENTEAYFGKFNKDQSNKLLKVFEEVSNKGVAFSNHDRLKGDQSKKRERVEPKGIDAYTIRHCARFWYFTNNENALYIQGDDRRFTCHKANNRYANNTDYFQPIWDEVRNQQFCLEAFEFFANRKYEMSNVYTCYETQFKLEQKQLNLPNGLKFIKDFVEDGGMDHRDKIPVKLLHQSYKDWCLNYGCKYHIGSFKTQLKKIDIVGKRIKSNNIQTKCYIINHNILLTKFRDYLKDPTFLFDL